MLLIFHLKIQFIFEKLRFAGKIHTPLLHYYCLLYGDPKFFLSGKTDLDLAQRGYVWRFSWKEKCWDLWNGFTSCYLSSDATKSVSFVYETTYYEYIISRKGSTIHQGCMKSRNISIRLSIVVMDLACNVIFR